MCDLWVHTLDGRVPAGAIPTQIHHALTSLMPGGACAYHSAAGEGRAACYERAPAPQIKLYNAGSFFDPAAIPPDDDGAIARALDPFARVIVEAHPAFLAGVHGERCLRFRDAIRGRLEVAIGLEAADDQVLARLNKRMTLETFRRAAQFLHRNDIDLRAFILLNPPFVPPSDAIELACRSVEFARSCGAVACSIIPTRAGNAGMPADFQPPQLADLERVIEYGLRAALTGVVNASVGHRGVKPSGAMRVFADLWDAQRFFDCACWPLREARLAQMNRTQQIPSPVVCSHGC